MQKSIFSYRINRVHSNTDIVTSMVPVLQQFAETGLVVRWSLFRV